jgi:Immunity protein 50
MTWLEFTENPKAISSLFDPIPSLNGVEIMSIKLARDGPTADLAIGLSECPFSAPSKWRGPDANAVVVELQLMGLESVEIEGWSTANWADIEIVRKSAAQLELLARTEKIRIHCVFGFLRILGVSPYTRVAHP